VPEQLFTVTQAAKTLRLSTGRIRQLIGEGFIKPTQMIGGSWVLTPADMERLANRPKRGRPPKTGAAKPRRPRK
jgi:hypothetical protein